MANLQGFFIMVPVFGFQHPFAGLLSISNFSVSHGIVRVSDPDSSLQDALHIIGCMCL